MIKYFIYDLCVNDINIIHGELKLSIVLLRKKFILSFYSSSILMFDKNTHQAID